MGNVKDHATIFLLFILLWPGSSMDSDVGGTGAPVASAGLSTQASIQRKALHHSWFNGTEGPRLQPTESVPVTGSYALRRGGKVCLKAVFGVEYIVKEKTKKSYFNINPSSTMATGYCGDMNATLSLDFDGGNLQFKFIKTIYTHYVSNLTAYLKPDCKSCKETFYLGVMDHDQLFPASYGLSFKCKSETVLRMGTNLDLKIVSMQIQGFDLTNGQFGDEVECWADSTKRITPLVLGAVAVAICLTAILVYVLTREHRGSGYEQL